MIHTPPRPRGKNKIEFPMSVLAMGDSANASEVSPTCPYQGCSCRLRWAPTGREEQGLVCKIHGVVWRESR
jgi:hypothetical protein